MSAPPFMGHLTATHLPITADLELVLQLVDGGDRGKQIDIRMARRTALGSEAEASIVGSLQPTCAGFRVPLALVPSVANALVKLARRATEDALWGPPSRGAA